MYIRMLQAINCEVPPIQLAEKTAVLIAPPIVMVLVTFPLLRMRV